ncbi:cytochrome C oxidase subunit IV family protein [bacterium]|nr:cytochrome C oxidase subunit IV family protein [bacterium]MBU1882615.1 cytochrome C oxidase subunit IV family protein [bacterium]
MEHTVVIYTKVLAGLLLLTLLTFLQPTLYHLTPGKTAGIQILIAVMKIGLIGVYYMHLRRETSYLKSYVVMAFVILLIFFVIVGIDVVDS